MRLFLSTSMEVNGMEYKQKTVRFYMRSPTEQEAYKKLSQYLDYGFKSERQMMISAINEYHDNTGFGAINLDILAEKIAYKLAGIQVITNNDKTISEEYKYDDKTDAYSKALDFIELL